MSHVPQHVSHDAQRMSHVPQHMSHVPQRMSHVPQHMSHTDAKQALHGSRRGGGLGSRPKKMYGEYLRDGVEYHLTSPTPRR